MFDLDAFRTQVKQQVGASMALNVAFVGISTGLLEWLGAHGPATAAATATGTTLDVGYITRWFDAAYAFELLDVDAEAQFSLTGKGRAFCPSTPGTVMPMAGIGAMAAHFADRAIGLFATGERPGEVVLGERPALSAIFGPMLEASFGPLFEAHVLPLLRPVYEAIDAKAGLVVDLGCGNGWYLRRLTAAFPNLRGRGVDGFAAVIEQAKARAETDRLQFDVGDLANLDQPADALVMNRALHHVWADRETVLPKLRAALAPGGALIIWEPSWPAEREALRAPNMRGMAFMNLGEHVQGNHFLRPPEIVSALEGIGLEVELHPILGGADVIVVGRAPA